LFEGLVDEFRDGLCCAFVGLLDGVEDGDLGEGHALVGECFDLVCHVVDDGPDVGQLPYLGLRAVVVEVIGEELGLAAGVAFVSRIA